MRFFLRDLNFRSQTYSELDQTGLPMGNSNMPSLLWRNIEARSVFVGG